MIRHVSKASILTDMEFPVPSKNIPTYIIKNGWFGAVLFGGATLAIHMVGLMVHGGDNRIGWMLLASYLLITAPTYHILSTFGCKWPGSFVEIPVGLFLFILFINSCIGVIASVLLRGVWQKIRLFFHN